MHGRWELSDEQWALLEPILRSKRRPDGKGRPPKEARTVLNGVFVDFRDGGTVAGDTGKISSVPDLPSPLSAVGAFGGAGEGVAETGAPIASRGTLESVGSLYRRDLRGGE